MSGRQIVIAKLVRATSVAELVGDKVWATVAPQSAPMPYVLVHMPSQGNRQLLDGDAGFPRSRIRVETVATTASAAEVIANRIFDALKNVTNEVIVGLGDPPEFIASATIVPADTVADGYSDARNGHISVCDFYVDWRRISNGPAENVLMLGEDTLTLGDDILTLGG